MKPNPVIALGISGMFAGTVLAAPYTHADEHLHLPPGSAPIAQTFAASTTTFTSGPAVVMFNAIHDAEYLLPPDTTPRKSDGQVEKG